MVVPHSCSLRKTNYREHEYCSSRSQIGAIIAYLVSNPQRAGVGSRNAYNPPHKAIQCPRYEVSASPPAMRWEQPLLWLEYLVTPLLLPCTGWCRAIGRGTTWF